MAEYPHGYFSSPDTSGNGQAGDGGMSVASALKSLFARPYATVSAAEAAALAGNGVVLLDVREPHEWQAGHAPKARHIALLARDGRKVSNLSGGMHAWASAGLPVVAKGGGSGRIA
jgi:3-mercaptopyruvate sulfurtransferase SseA